MKKSKICILFCSLFGLILICLFVVYQFYTSPVDKNSKAPIEVVIPNGMNTKNIAKLLENKGLIRSSDFFYLYLKLNHISSLKASTYTLKKSMSMDKIVKTIEKGNQYNPDAIRITFKEGECFTDFASLIASYTNHTYEEVIQQGKDSSYLQTLIDKYWFLTDEILNSDLYYPLEGYLAPNTYEFKNKDVSVASIFEEMLDMREEELEPYKNIQSDHTIHEFLSLASMLEKEGTNFENRAMIAGVFYHRLEKGMNLGSDVTTYYALQVPMTSDLTTAQFNTQNPYNTRGPGMLGKLPVGPICNPSFASIKASIEPKENDYLYFVADKNGKIYYTKTNEEHLQKVQEIKEKGDWIW